METDIDGNPLTLAEINERKELAKLRERMEPRVSARESVLESASSPPKPPEESGKARSGSNAADGFLAEQASLAAMAFSIGALDRTMGPPGPSTLIDDVLVLQQSADVEINLIG